MKDRLVLTLGEDLAEEKEWQWEGIAVLTAHLFCLLYTSDAADE